MSHKSRGTTPIEVSSPSHIWRHGAGYTIALSKAVFENKEMLSITLFHEAAHVQLFTHGLQHVPLKNKIELGAKTSIKQGYAPHLDGTHHYPIYYMQQKLILKNGWQDILSENWTTIFNSNSILPDPVYYNKISNFVMKVKW